MSRISRMEQLWGPFNFPPGPRRPSLGWNPKPERSMEPGTIMFLPPDALIPANSVIRQDPQYSFPFFGHPVLILEHNEAEGIAHFLPIISLRGEMLERQREIAPRLVWPCFVLIDEALLEEDFQRRNDPDFVAFPTVNLDRFSFRTDLKHWVVIEKVWRVEKAHLTVYPLSSPAQRPHSLPNPRCYVSERSLLAIRTYVAYYASHAPCVEPPISQLFTPPRTRPQIGHIYRLPLITDNEYLHQAQTFSYYERPLGKPFLITAINAKIGRMTTYGSQVAVRGFILTNFHHRPIRMYLGQEDSMTQWLRYQYLPIEGPGAERHDGLPAVPLANGSPRFHKTWYVHALKQYLVEERQVQAWVADGTEEIRVTPQTVKALLEWHHALKSGRNEDDFDMRRMVVRSWGMVGSPWLVPSLVSGGDVQGRNPGNE